MYVSSGQVLDRLQNGFNNEAARKLCWETKSNKMSAHWTARTPEGDRYTITQRGKREGAVVHLSLAIVTFKERGTPRGVRGERIASADTFELAAACATHHYYRISNGRRVAARNAAKDAKHGGPDPLDVPARLAGLKGMRDGWLEGDGKAPDKDGLQWLSESFDHHYPKDAPLPHTYPTPEGGIEMEWMAETTSLSLEVDLAERKAHYLAFEDASGDSFTERDLDLDDDAAEAWRWIANQVRRTSDGR